MAPVIDVALPPERRAPSRARAALEPLEAELEGGTMHSLHLLVSELVTNSVRHGALAERDSIRLAVVSSPDRVRVEVTDPGRGFGDRAVEPLPAGESGWGLYLVDRVADRWGVWENGRTHVWFELDRSA